MKLLLDLEWRKRQSMLDLLDYPHKRGYLDKIIYLNEHRWQYRKWSEEEVYNLIIMDGLACRPEDHKVRALPAGAGGARVHIGCPCVPTHAAAAWLYGCMHARVAPLPSCCTKATAPCRACRAVCCVPASYVLPFWAWLPARCYLPFDLPDCFA